MTGTAADSDSGSAAESVVVAEAAVDTAEVGSFLSAEVVSPAPTD